MLYSELPNIILTETAVYTGSNTPREPLIETFAASHLTELFLLFCRELSTERIRTTRAASCR